MSTGSRPLVICKHLFVAYTVVKEQMSIEGGGDKGECTYIKQAKLSNDLLNCTDNVQESRHFTNYTNAYICLMYVHPYAFV